MAKPISQWAQESEAASDLACLAVLVTAAGVQDSTAGKTLLDQATASHPGLRKIWVDSGYRQHLVEHVATLGIDMEITQREPGTRGFTPIPKR